jgi:hypothetical protein
MVVVNTDAFTIKRSGLYHFDYFLQVSALSSEAPSYTLYMSGVIPSSSITFVKDEQIKLGHQATVFKANHQFSFDIYIKAPATISLNRYMIGASSGGFFEGNLLGHFIRD